MRVVRSSRLPSRASSARRGESRPRLERIEFFGHVVTSDNVVACGRRVYDFCCREYACVAKARDVAMVPFPPFLWGVPLATDCTPDVAGTPEMMGFCVRAESYVSRCNGVCDDDIALDGLSCDRECDNDGVVTCSGCN